MQYFTAILSLLFYHPKQRYREREEGREKKKERKEKKGREGGRKNQDSKIRKHLTEPLMHEELVLPKQQQYGRLGEADGHTAGMLVCISLMRFIF